MVSNTLQRKQHSEVFYQKLGYLFYSIAAADHRVSAAEKEALLRLIVEDWLNLDDATDAYGTDSAYQIQILFDFLNEKSFDAEHAWSIFERYFKSHLVAFNDDIIDRIFHTAERLAESMNGRNKSEVLALTRLHLLLGKEKHIL
jgi:hypothetical protein